MVIHFVKPSLVHVKPRNTEGKGTPVLIGAKNSIQGVHNFSVHEHGCVGVVTLRGLDYSVVVPFPDAFNIITLDSFEGPSVNLENHVA